MPQPELFTLRGMVWWIVLVGVLPQPELFYPCGVQLIMMTGGLG
jgi:hypothetical protein